MFNRPSNQSIRRVYRFALVLPLLATACLAPQGGVTPVQVFDPNFPDVWAEGPSTVKGEGKASKSQSRFYDRETGGMRVVGLPGETVGFQIVLDGSKSSAGGISVGAEDLLNGDRRIERANIAFFRQWPVKVVEFENWYLRNVGPREPREYPDVLVPVDAPEHGQPFRIARGEDLKLWCDIRIPLETSAGRYQGAFLLQASDGSTRRIPLVLSVGDIKLDPKSRLDALASVQIRPLLKTMTSVDADNPRQVLSSEASRAVITAAFKMLHDHGLSPMSNDIKPRFRQDIGGNFSIDWQEYDDLFGPFITGSAYEDNRAAAAWPLPLDETYPDPSSFGGAESANYNNAVRNYMQGCVAHFKEKGWIDKTFAYFDLPSAANPSAGDVARIDRLATLTHLVDNGMSFASRLPPQNMQNFGWFQHAHADLTTKVDIWNTPACYVHPPTLKKLHTLGKATWMNPDHPPFSGSLAVEAPVVQARSLPWQAFLFDHDALHIGQTTVWPSRVTQAPLGRSGPTDDWLLYPGKPFGLDTPVPSLRLKLLRLGLADYQRLRLLEARGRSETARLLARSLMKASGTEAYGDNYQDGVPGLRIDDPELWELARRILDDELGAVSGADAEGAGRGAWTRLLATTRKVYAWCEGTRLIFRSRGEKSQYALTFHVAVRNDLANDITGEVDFGELPPRARRISDTVKIGPVDSLAVGRNEISLATETLPDLPVDGHLTQEISFDAGRRGNLTILAQASIAQVVTLSDAPKIDGRLNEWPPATVNAAADFGLITEQFEPGAERAPARSQTVAYFGRDDENLYIALSAQSPRGKGGGSSRTLRNFVEYEDLMPTGDDLVEILIDPTGSGAVPGDLFHLVVKSNGNPKFERGISTDPPIGKVAPWPGSQPEVTVRRTSDGWAAEVAIPIASFGKAGAENRVWGLNIARFEPVRGEYSDWARAPRYCYDPRTLGNLVWPE